MVYTTPDYFDDFLCIADKCPDTCCSGWQIVINDEYLEKYKEKNTFPTINMHEYVDFKEKVFKQSEDRRCSFLRDDNLCKLCFEYGEDALCKTCHLYPRHIEEFENVRETTLSLSCPEVARIILSRFSPVKFISKETDEYEEYDDFDFMLYSTLLDARDVMIEILQNRSIPIDVRAGMVLGLCHDIDKRFNEDRFFTVQELLDYAVTTKALERSCEKIEKYKSDSKKVYDRMYKKYKKLFKLEPISYDWINLYTETEYILYKKGEKFYTEKSKEFDEYMCNKAISFDIQLEQILVYFIFTYFCGAVYDGDIYGKGKLSVYSAYYIKELLKAAYIRNDGEILEDEIQDIVLRYSRELEHSDINLNRIEGF
ncbi:MAG: flagellin lysine-N-methylase [Lachnospiraceae bacterium]|nr:flagellin lysine-N-methylase [Lachnospiraceae bacterium]